MAVTKAKVLIVPRTRETAEQWVRSCVDWFCGGFHPDTPAQDYVNQSGRRTFNAEEQWQFDMAREAAFKLTNGDPYAIGVEYIDSKKTKT